MASTLLCPETPSIINAMNLPFIPKFDIVDKKVADNLHLIIADIMTVIQDNRYKSDLRAHAYNVMRANNWNNRYFSDLVEIIVTLGESDAYQANRDPEGFICSYIKQFLDPYIAWIWVHTNMVNEYHTDAPAEGIDRAYKEMMRIFDRFYGIVGIRDHMVPTPSGSKYHGVNTTFEQPYQTQVNYQQSYSQPSQMTPVSQMASVPQMTPTGYAVNQVPNTRYQPQQALTNQISSVSPRGPVVSSASSYQGPVRTSLTMPQVEQNSSVYQENKIPKAPPSRPDIVPFDIRHRVFPDFHRVDDIRLSVYDERNKEKLIRLLKGGNTFWLYNYGNNIMYNNQVPQVFVENGQHYVYFGNDQYGNAIIQPVEEVANQWVSPTKPTHSNLPPCLPINGQVVQSATGEGYPPLSSSAIATQPFVGSFNDAQHAMLNHLGNPYQVKHADGSTQPQLIQPQVSPQMNMSGYYQPQVNNMAPAMPVTQPIQTTMPNLANPIPGVPVYQDPNGSGYFIQYQPVLIGYDNNQNPIYENAPVYVNYGQPQPVSTPTAPVHQAVGITQGYGYPSQVQDTASGDPFARGIRNMATGEIMEDVKKFRTGSSIKYPYAKQQRSIGHHVEASIHHEVPQKPINKEAYVASEELVKRVSVPGRGFYPRRHDSRVHGPLVTQPKQEVQTPVTTNVKPNVPFHGFQPEPNIPSYQVKFDELPEPLQGGPISYGDDGVMELDPDNMPSFTQLANELRSRRDEIRAQHRGGTDVGVRRNDVPDGDSESDWEQYLISQEELEGPDEEHPLFQRFTMDPDEAEKLFSNQPRKDDVGLDEYIDLLPNVSEAFLKMEQQLQDPDYFENRFMNDVTEDPEVYLATIRGYEMLKANKEYKFTNRNMYNEMLDETFGKDWYPTESQKEWMLYDVRNFKCEVVINEKGHPVQVITERKLSMEEKDHFIPNTVPGQNPLFRPSHKPDAYKQYQEALENLSKSHDELKEMQAKLSEEGESTSIVPTKVSGTVLGSSLKEVNIITRRRVLEKGDKAIISNHDVCITNPLVTEVNDVEFVEEITKCKSFKEARSVLIRKRDEMTEETWCALETRLTEELNWILNQDLLSTLSVDSVLEDLPELQAILSQRKLLEDFEAIAAKRLPKLFMSIHDGVSDHDVIYLRGLESEIDIDLDKEVDEDTLRNMKVTLMPELSNVTLLNVVNSDFIGNNAEARAKAISTKNQASLLKIAKWIYQESEGKYNHHYVITKDDMIYEIHRNDINKDLYTIRKVS